jgi:hypothetical protein
MEGQLLEAALASFEQAQEEPLAVQWVQQEQPMRQLYWGPKGHNRNLGIEHAEVRAGIVMHKHLKTSTSLNILPLPLLLK